MADFFEEFSRRVSDVASDITKKTGDTLEIQKIKRNVWYSYNGERIGQGRENVKIFLKDHPEICEEIEKREEEIEKQEEEIVKIQGEI